MFSVLCSFSINCNNLFIYINFAAIFGYNIKKNYCLHVSRKFPLYLFLVIWCFFVIHLNFSWILEWFLCIKWNKLLVSFFWHGYKFSQHHFFIYHRFFFPCFWYLCQLSMNVWVYFRYMFGVFIWYKTQKLDFLHSCLQSILF